MPPRLRPATPQDVAAAWSTVRGGETKPADRNEAIRLLTKHFLAVLAARSPGNSVEVRVPPYAAVQCVAGSRHTRGTPPAVVEMSPETWLALVSGELTWDSAVTQHQVRASGERSDLGPLLPLA